MSDSTFPPPSPALPPAAAPPAEQAPPRAVLSFQSGARKDGAAGATQGALSDLGSVTSAHTRACDTLSTVSTSSEISYTVQRRPLCSPVVHSLCAATPSLWSRDLASPVSPL
jgi:hypothetical protein